MAKIRDTKEGRKDGGYSRLLKMRETHQRDNIAYLKERLLALNI